MAVSQQPRVARFLYRAGLRVCSGRPAGATRFPLPKQSCGRHNAGVTNQPPETKPPRRDWHVGRWLVALLLVVCGYFGWREYDYRAAILEAKAAGFEWQAKEPFDVILKDWHAAFRKATWTDGYRQLKLGNAPLARHCSLLHRLRPTLFEAWRCSDADLDALKELTGLQNFFLTGNPALQNVDGLKRLTGLQHLNLYRCASLQNVDSVKGLTGL